MSRFPYGKAFLFSSSFFGINVIWALFNNFVPTFLGELGLSATLIGFVMTWDNYINMFVQPIIGRKSDQTFTRFGRRKPWLLVGAPLAAIFFVNIPLSTSLFYIAIAILLTNISMTLFRSPAVAFLGDLFPSDQRSIAGGILDFMGGLGAIIALIGGWFLFDQLKLGLVPTFTFGSLVMLGGVIIVLLKIQEPKPHNQNIYTNNTNLITDLNQIFQQGNWSTFVILPAFLCGFLGIEIMQAWLSSFGLFSLGINSGRMSGIAVSFALSFLIFTFPAGWLATQFGRSKIIFVGFVFMTCLFVFGWFVQNEIMLISLLIGGGMAWALVSVNALPMIYDIFGDTHIGVSTGLYYLATNLAAAIGPQASGIFIDLTGKNFRVIFFISAIFMALATFTMLRVIKRSSIEFKQI